MVHFAQLTNTETTYEALHAIDVSGTAAMVCLNDDIDASEGDAVDEILQAWYGTHWPTPSIWEDS